MSAGPNRVAPVSRPETVITAESMWCSMKGRASVMQILRHTPLLTTFNIHAAMSAPSELPPFCGRAATVTELALTALTAAAWASAAVLSFCRPPALPPLSSLSIWS